MAEMEVPNAEELEEHARDAFPKRGALSTAVFAVVLAIASLGGSNAMKEMLLAQQKASNQWAFYQAKATRERQAEIELLSIRRELARLELDVAERGLAFSDAARRLREAIDAAVRAW